jgi:hypothetical protein
MIKSAIAIQQRPEADICATPTIVGDDCKKTNNPRNAAGIIFASY